MNIAFNASEKLWFWLAQMQLLYFSHFSVWVFLNNMQKQLVNGQAFYQLLKTRK